MQRWKTSHGFLDVAAGGLSTQSPTGTDVGSQILARHTWNRSSHPFVGLSAELDGTSKAVTDAQGYVGGGWTAFTTQRCLPLLGNIRYTTLANGWIGGERSLAEGTSASLPLYVLQKVQARFFDLSITAGGDVLREKPFGMVKLVRHLKTMKHGDWNAVVSVGWNTFDSRLATAGQWSSLLRVGLQYHRPGFMLDIGWDAKNHGLTPGLSGSFPLRRPTDPSKRSKLSRLWPSKLTLRWPAPPWLLAKLEWQTARGKTISTDWPLDKSAEWLLRISKKRNPFHRAARVTQKKLRVSA